MRGLWVTEYTDFDKLTVEEIPRSALESKQIRLRIHAAGISFSANLVVTGKYQRKPPLPFTPGTGLAAVEIGKILGATVIATASTAENAPPRRITAPTM